MKRYDVNCASCCGTFHETTRKFDAGRMATGDMLALKPAFKASRWESFPEYDSTDYPDMVCPSCGMMYCNDVGRIIRLQEIGEFEDDTPVKQSTMDIIEPVELDTTPAEPDEFPEFDDDGRAQCPYCDERPTKQWWTRHLAKHETGK